MVLGPDTIFYFFQQTCIALWITLRVFIKNSLRRSMGHYYIRTVRYLRPMFLWLLFIDKLERPHTKLRWVWWAPYFYSAVQDDALRVKHVNIRQNLPVFSWVLFTLWIVLHPQFFIFLHVNANILVAGDRNFDFVRLFTKPVVYLPQLTFLTLHRQISTVEKYVTCWELFRHLWHFIESVRYHYKANVVFTRPSIVC